MKKEHKKNNNGWRNKCNRKRWVNKEHISENSKIVIESHDCPCCEEELHTDFHF